MYLYSAPSGTLSSEPKRPSPTRPASWKLDSVPFFRPLHERLAGLFPARQKGFFRTTCQNAAEVTGGMRKCHSYNLTAPMPVIPIPRQGSTGHIKKAYHGIRVITFSLFMPQTRIQLLTDCVAGNIVVMRIDMAFGRITAG